MASVQWAMRGEWFETCNCEFLCPCIITNMTAQPTRGDCIVAGAYRIDEGHYGDTTLDGLKFITVIRTPGRMIDGNWTLGVIIDERASAAQRHALATIAAGKAGGPPGRLGQVLGTFAGVAYAPIRFDMKGLDRAVSAGGLVEEGVTGVASQVQPGQAIVIDNAAHPSNIRLALAHATKSHVHVFGIDWDDDSGNNNGHFAPFDWKGP